MSVGADAAHPLDALIGDPSGKAPMCGEETFVQVMESMVADSMPQLFAVIQEYGDRVDVRIAAWGMAFADHVEVVSTDRSMRMNLASPEDAQRAFAWGSYISARLLWAA